MSDGRPLTPPRPAPGPQQEDKDDDGQMKVMGRPVAGIVGVIILVLFGLWFRRRVRKNREEDANRPEGAPPRQNQAPDPGGVGAVF